MYESQRVQLGKALRPGEKLQSLDGPWPAWIKSVVEEHVEAPGMLSTHLSWKTERGAAFQSLTWAVSSLLFTFIRVDSP